MFGVYVVIATEDGEYGDDGAGGDGDGDVGGGVGC